MSQQPIRYIVATSPIKDAPEGRTSSAEPARWYWESKGQWTLHKDRAKSFNSPGDAVDRIRDLRSRISGVEFILEPLVGESMDVPADRGLQNGRRKPEDMR
jgi:hypothetical protein